MKLKEKKSILRKGYKKNQSKIGLIFKTLDLNHETMITL
jgi:hypothetical protein